jgi:outer membrane protein OmpA-like peptidoglycan-associated protein
MKILITGFLVFACWASFSTWIYVCKIKAMCGDSEPVVVSVLMVNDPYRPDSLLTTSSATPVRPGMVLVYFAYDKSEIPGNSRLPGYSDSSIMYMNYNTEAGLFITGHTDSKGTDDYNMALGYRRAQSIRDYFVNGGIAAEKITIVSKGEEEPIESNSTDEGRAINRRASVSVIINK